MFNGRHYNATKNLFQHLYTDIKKFSNLIKNNFIDEFQRFVSQDTRAAFKLVQVRGSKELAHCLWQVRSMLIDSDNLVVYLFFHFKHKEDTGTDEVTIVVLLHCRTRQFSTSLVGAF